MGKLLHPPLTHSGDNCACKEETAAEVPVAGVGGVALWGSRLHPGFHDDLWSSRGWEEEVADSTAGGQLPRQCFT